MIWYNTSMNNGIKVHKWSKIPKQEQAIILRRSQSDIEKLYKQAIPIVEKVRKKGDEALVSCNKEFENVSIPASKLRVTPSEFTHAEKILPQSVKKAIQTAYKNIFNYHKLSIPNQDTPFSEVVKGVLIREKTTPIHSVGLYIPRGKGNFPSMVYMLAIPALLAKVPRRVMVTPPLPDGTIDPACLYTAKLCEVHEIYKVGGAHAIAALTFGTKTIAQVDKIIGPCSAFVSAAKRYVSTYVDIGTPAGPSESIIIADGTTPAELIAYDLCIEAEHGKDSMAIVLTHKKEFAQSIATHLQKILDSAPSAPKKILKTVFNKYKGIILTDSEEHSIELCNTMAPEHLMIHSETPSTIASLITNAGEILLGKYSPFSLANYAAGANAIIPTGGLSRSYSSVSIKDFIKHHSIVQITNKGMQDMIPPVKTLAQYEGFHFHEKALSIREKYWDSSSS